MISESTRKYRRKMIYLLFCTYVGGLGIATFLATQSTKFVEQALVFALMVASVCSGFLVVHYQLLCSVYDRFSEVEANIKRQISLKLNRGKRK